MSPTKKIAILSDFPLHVLPEGSFSAPAGHYATWLPQLARAFEEEKEFEFHWVALNSGVRKHKTVKAWNQNFHILPTERRGRATTLFWADRGKIQKKLREINPRVVHGWGNEDIWGWAATFSGFPNLFSLQGLLSEYAKLGGVGLRNRLMAWMETRVLKKAEIITTESPWARALVEKKTDRSDVRIVEYGVPNEFFEAEPSADAQNPYAIMVGTADYRKGIDFAVQLFSRPELRKHQLKIVGGVASFGEVWKRNSPANVSWLGRKPQAEIIQLMSKASCLVLPTRGDTGPTVAKEARVIGLPIVASPHGGHVQYVKSEINGFVCSLDAPEEWSRAIQHLFNNPAQAKAMGLAERNAHRELLKPERTAASFLALYRERIAEYSAGNGER